MGLRGFGSDKARVRLALSSSKARQRPLTSAFWTIAAFPPTDQGPSPPDPIRSAADPIRRRADPTPRQRSPVAGSGPGGVRTHDQGIMSPLLSPLSYRPDWVSTMLLPSSVARRLGAPCGETARRPDPPPGVTRQRKQSHTKSTPSPTTPRARTGIANIRKSGLAKNHPGNKSQFMSPPALQLPPAPPIATAGHPAPEGISRLTNPARPASGSGTHHLPPCPHRRGHRNNLRHSPTPP